MTLYDDLGVPKHADQAAIRKAYRRRAQRAHPDKGGSAADFERITHAYKVLTDQRRRANYDATGNDSTQPEPPLDVQAMGGIASVLISMMDQADTAHTDLIALLREHFRQQLQALNTNRQRLKSAIVKREKAVARIRRKTAGDNLLAQFIQSDIANGQRNLAGMDDQERLIKRVLELVAEYECTGNAPTPQMLSNLVFISTR